MKAKIVMGRREFLQVFAAAGAAAFMDGLPIPKSKSAKPWTLGLFGPRKDSGSIEEMTGKGYRRAEVELVADGPSSVTNRAPVYFPQAAGTWGTVSHIALFNGEMLVRAVPIGANQSVFIESGDSSAVMDGGLTIELK